MFRILLIVSIASIALASCSTSSFIRINNTATSYQSTSAESIEIYSLTEIGKEYEAIGQVTAAADAGENAIEAIKWLKIEAARMGADAVVNLELSFCNGFWTIAIKASGTAVKFKNMEEK